MAYLALINMQICPARAPKRQNLTNLVAINRRAALSLFPGHLFVGDQIALDLSLPDVDCSCVRTYFTQSSTFPSCPIIKSKSKTELKSKCHFELSQG